MERQPILADHFYPADERARDAAVAALFPEPAAVGRALGVVLPQGSLLATGATAAEALAQVEVPELAVVLGSSHAMRAPRGAVMCLGAVRLPGARVPVDTRFAEDLAGVAMLEENGAPFERDHALEAVLPLLLHRNPRLRVVPVVFSPLPHPTVVRIGKALADAIQNHGRDVLVVATTSLASYLPSREVEALDARALAAIEALDASALTELVTERPEAMDGAAAVGVLLSCARALGRTSARLVAHRVRTPNIDRVGECHGYASLIVP